MSILRHLPADVVALRQTLREQIISLSAKAADPGAFEPLALAVFRYQAAHNPVYAAYLRLLGVQPERVTDLRRVPFMPIGFFKTQSVLTGFNADGLESSESLTFASSGTTGRGAGPQQTSRHLVPDAGLYDAVSTHIFERTYGPLGDFHILALLPSYLERKNSSLVYMVRRFMEQSGPDQSGSGHSGFFLHDHDALTERLRQLSNQTDGSPKRILLIGVTFALLDWAESGRDLSFLGRNPDVIVMETGGMKGRRKELLREEVHAILTERLGVRTIHSEYGMTELLSQAYSSGEGVFRPSPTLRVYVRDINDPFAIYSREDSRGATRQTGERRTGPRQTGSRQTGGINVVDLANLDSCSFIETGDLGQYVGAEGNFRVIGRFDNADVRGCNLMVVD